MRGSLSQVVGSVGERLFREEQGLPSRIPSLEEVIADAHQEWLAAQNYFENVSDPELVDHAIYLLEAAERKYVYLLRQARTSDVHSVTGTI